MHRSNLIPEEYVDSDTGKLMEDPVRVVVNGKIKIIDRTTLPADFTQFTICGALKTEIQLWKKTNFVNTIKPSQQGMYSQPNTEYDYLLKLKLLGDSGVGKTSLIQRFVDNTFKDSFINALPREEFGIKKINTMGYDVKLQIWDTPRQERFSTIASNHMRGAHGVIIIFDLTNVDSFINLSKYIDDVRYSYAENTQIIIVGSKCDLLSERKIDEEEVREFVESLHDRTIKGPYIISAKENIGVNEIFEEMAKLYLCKIDIKPRMVEEKISSSSEKISSSSLGKKPGSDGCNIL